jgi:hypothetical protein
MLMSEDQQNNILQHHVPSLKSDVELVCNKDYSEDAFSTFVNYEELKAGEKISDFFNSIRQKYVNAFDVDLKKEDSYSILEIKRMISDLTEEERKEVILKFFQSCLIVCTLFQLFETVSALYSKGGGPFYFDRLLSKKQKQLTKRARTTSESLQRVNSNFFLLNYIL